MATLREGLRLSPNHPELQYQYGVMLAATDQVADAVKCFEKTLATDATHARAHERLAQCLALSGHHEGALEHLQRAHQLEPANRRVALQLNLLAQSILASGESPQVEWHPLVRAVRSSKTAIERLGDLIAREPDFVETFLDLPASEVDQEVFSTLAATLECALARHPEYADLHYHCGAVYRRLGHHGSALRHVEQALDINPRYVNALILLAELYAQTQRWTDGIARLEQAVRRGGDLPDVHYLIGCLCQRQDRPERAREAFRRALALKQDYPAAKEALSRLQAVPV